MYGLMGLIACVLVFGGRKDVKSQYRMYWQHVVDERLYDDVMDPLQLLGGVGYVLQSAFSAGRALEGSQGEKGFWIKHEQYEFLNRFASTMKTKSRSAKRDLGRFTDFIEKHILAAFAQEEVSMTTLVKEGIARVKKQYKGKIAINFSVERDFKAKVLKDVFPNTIANLAENAVLHGNASLLEVVIDGEKREIRIKDNGKGIPVGLLPYIFELHYSNGRKSGTGLPFLRMVVETASGKVFCYSKEGSDDSFTEFVIRFP
jgi:signal transduction histidine kinase